jgi:hypothetical protein
MKNEYRCNQNSHPLNFEQNISQQFSMVGILANRAQFGLILPSTNTSVEAEFNRMLVPGLSSPSNLIKLYN